jgi:RHS repeat-associated protein
VPLSGTPWGGKLTSITDALGRSTTFFYNADNRISSIMDPFGRTASLGYDGNGNLTGITDMGGFTSSFSYDGCGTVQTMTTGNNKVTFSHGFNTLTVSDYMGSETFTLNSLTGESSYQGANASAGSTYGYTKTVTPDGNSDITGFQTPEGLAFGYSYDSKGNLLTQTLQGAGGAETASFTYNAKGKVTSVVPPVGARTDITYAANGVDPLTVTQAGLGTITATYNSTHDILSLTDRMGLLKTFTFNTSGQPTSSLGAGILTSFSYDSSKQLTGITRAGTTVGSYGYDSIGRLASYTDQNGFTLQRSYNNLDDLLSITYPDSTSATFVRSLAVPHLLDRMTDQAGRTTRYSYNPHSQLSKIIDPAGGQTRFSYDAAGHASQLIDPNNNSTLLAYTKDNRLTRKQFADGNALQFAYPHGRMTWSKNARGGEATYSYDKNGNLLSVTYSDGTPGVTTVYDAYNRPVTVSDALGSRTISYDASSRVTAVDGPWANDSLSFSYDTLGRKTSQALQQGLTASYSYDSLDRLTAVTGNGTTYTYSYQGGGTLLQRLARSDSSKTDYSYDPVMKRLQQQINYLPTGTVLNGYSYSFDSLGQPTGETVTNGPALQFVAAGTVDATYNNLNQVATWGGSSTAISYDADGNMTKGLTPDGRAFTAAYDAENRMTFIQYTDGGGVIRRQEFTYGSDGYLGIQKSYANGALTGERRFIWDAGKLLQERDGSNAVVRDYLWGINQPGGVGALLSLKQGGAAYQVFSNPRGDVTAVLNSSGEVVASYAYDPFGGPLATGGTLSQPIRYSTKLYDEGTGLYYFGHRFYSPQMGRWLSRDPLAEMASINLYRFAANNPLTHFDPFGAADNGGFWDRPEVQAQLQAQREALQAKRASEVTTFEKVKSSIGSAFKWIGDKFKEQPEMARSIEEKVANTALEANKYTKAGKEWNERINTAIQLAEDYGTVKAALKDDDPASGLTLIKVGAKYTVGRIPAVGEAYSEVIVKAVETVENAPGGVEAARRMRATGGTNNNNEASQLGQVDFGGGR